MFSTKHYENHTSVKIYDVVSPVERHDSQIYLQMMVTSYKMYVSGWCQMQLSDTTPGLWNEEEMKLSPKTQQFAKKLGISRFKE